MTRLCRACGEVSRGRGDCPWCGSASVYAAADCPVCGGAREEKDVLCDTCANILRQSFRRYLAALTAAERKYLDAALDGRGIAEI